jgi:hypothetical protein
MAKIKNTSNQPRGFFTDEGAQVTVQPGEEKEFNMTEADYKKIEELVASEERPSFEISGGHGGTKKLTAKEQKEADDKKAADAAKKAESEQKAAEKK